MDLKSKDVFWKLNKSLKLKYLSESVLTNWNQIYSDTKPYQVEKTIETNDDEVNDEVSVSVVH